MVSDKIQRTIQQYFNGWTARSVETLDECMTDNVDFHDITVGKHFGSKAEWREHQKEIFGAITNPKMNVVATSGNDTDFAATEWTMTFNYTNQSPLLPIPAENQEIRMMGVCLNWYDGDGKIVRAHHYGKFLLDPPSQEQ